MAMLLEPRKKNSTRLRQRGCGGFLVGRLGTIAFLAILAAVTNLSAAEGPVDDGSDHWAFVAPQQAALPRRL